MNSEDDIRSRYPLHYLVWSDDKDGLKRYLKQDTKANLELKDPRGRTPLMLAVTLGFKKCARILLNHNACVNVTDATGFNVLHEAVSLMDPEFIRDVYEQKEVQRYSRVVRGIPNLLSKICDTTDFYVEMKWEFTSWLPLISRWCPNDTYKIYKSGSKIRIDTTLVGFGNPPNWKRGNTSYIFSGFEDGAVFMEVDHVAKQIIKKTMKVITQDEIEFLQPSEEQIFERLTNPISTTFIDTERISFERSKSGIIGFRTDRSESVNGYECKVFYANDVDLLTKVRLEHLSREDKDRYKNSQRFSLRSIAGISESVFANPFEANPPDDSCKQNPYKLSLLDYFRPPDGENRDIGTPRELLVKTQHFKANLWLSEEFPLSLPEQVLPILDLMAISSSHCAKLRDFVNLKIPPGFPVKIEIPLFHLLNARITFGNVFATDEPVPGVSTATPDTRPGQPPQTGIKCTVDESFFEAPSTYEVIGNDSDFANEALNDFGEENLEDVNMQYALEQYFKQECIDGSDQMTFLEIVKNDQPDDCEQSSAKCSAKKGPKVTNGEEQDSESSSDSYASCNEQLDAEQSAVKALIEKSRKDHEEDVRLQLLEEEMLQKALQLSLSEK